MKIERVDDKTVRCFLSNEELEAYEIDYKDFITRTEKAREIVQEIIVQAEEEVGYKPPKFAFDLQIMMVPDQGLVLTFSDKDAEIKDGVQIMECLREMKKFFEKTKEQQALTDSVKPERKEAESQPDFGLFVFSSIHNVMNYARSLPANLRVESVLYELDGFYYLYLKKGHASYKRFSRACIQAMEFAGLYGADESRMSVLREHGTCLIAEKALKKIRA